ncbi:UNVERIFIED_CONTAM: hypothetical protein Sangu_2042400 [Sesamum angustifolium]|uniref:Uncharacterized protein n=1 Tax=Sesamum angustifolium TaxID=2727405 RepID=A0AAW2LJL1_9LAMI
MASFGLQENGWASIFPILRIRPLWLLRCITYGGQEREAISEFWHGLGATCDVGDRANATKNLEYGVRAKLANISAAGFGN